MSVKPEVIMEVTKRNNLFGDAILSVRWKWRKLVRPSLERKRHPSKYTISTTSNNNNNNK
jgi:hypothetical protein